MLKITLTPEQEQFLQAQLKTGKYNNPQEVISKAFKLLEKEIKPNYLLIFQPAHQLKRS